MKRKQRVRRIFSTELKQRIVKDIEQGKSTIAGVCREYSVSNVSIYRWLNKYSSFLKKGVKVVMESASEGYRSKELEKEVRDLQAALGRKQIQVEFLEKMIELAGHELGIDIKKKFSISPSTGSAPKKVKASK